MCIVFITSSLSILSRVVQFAILRDGAVYSGVYHIWPRPIIELKSDEEETI